MCGAHRHLPSFPTRRSSDLLKTAGSPQPRSPPASMMPQTSVLIPAIDSAAPNGSSLGAFGSRDSGTSGTDRASAPSAIGRSEEHTSELQSRQYLVCRLLLEK